MIQDEEKKFLDFNDWSLDFKGLALNQEQGKMHKHAIPLKRKSASLALKFEQIKEEMKVKQEDIQRKRSEVLPTIEEEPSFQLDSSRKKVLDTIKLQKLEIVRQFDNTFKWDSFGSLRMKPVPNVNSQSVSLFKVFTEAENLFSTSNPQPEAKSQ